jgi:hypothetical protein
MVAQRGFACESLVQILLPQAVKVKGVGTLSAWVGADNW